MIPLQQVDRRGQHRVGMTIVEVLVTIAIVGVVSALLLPAIQSARQSSRRAGCASNLRQLGLATHCYHDAQGCLPPGRVKSYDPRFMGSYPPCSSASVDKSILIYILPFIDQKALFDSVNNDLTIFGPENRTIHTVVVSAYACPTDYIAGRASPLQPDALVPFWRASDGQRPAMVSSSYIGCTGSPIVNAFALPSNGCKVPTLSSCQSDGCFNDISPISISAITDGLSNTVLLSERSNSATAPLDSFFPGLSARHGWYVSGNWGDTLGTNLFPPNAFRKVAASAANAILDSSSSLHPGGVNVAMGDSSVRFIRDTIQTCPADPSNGWPLGIRQSANGSWANIPTPGIWQALSTRASGELLSSSDF